MDTNSWSEVEPHIERHKSGCWTWDASPVEGNVYRIVAKAYGAPLPIGIGKLYRMPDCKFGMKCVNPNHIGTKEDYFLTLDGQRRDWPEPKTGNGIGLTKQDREFLKKLKIAWD